MTTPLLKQLALQSKRPAESTWRASYPNLWAGRFVKAKRDIRETGCARKGQKSLREVVGGLESQGVLCMNFL